MSLREEIVEQAMALPPEDRAFVADQLERSLPRADALSPEVAEEWSREIDRRIASYDRGETQAVDFESALGHMRAALNAHRAGPARQ